MSRAFLMERQEDLAFITVDVPGRRVNVLSMEVLDEFQKIVQNLADEKGLKGAMILSAKPSGFLAGADISEIEASDASAYLSEISERAQSVFGKLERLRIPVVAAIHGPCLGGGMELALACTGRILSNTRTTCLGLPETTLGIIPCFGGTQRLPRRVGIMEAARMITRGRTVSAEEALHMGLADEVVPEELLLKAARRFLVRSRGRPSVRTAFGRTILRRMESIPPVRDMLFRRARTQAGRRFREFYPAPLLALDAMEEGMRHGMDEGLSAETHLVGQAASTETARNLLRVFRLRKFYSKVSTVPADTIQRAGVIGVGAMGSGITTLLVRNGVHARLIDKSFTVLGAGLRKISTDFGSRQPWAIHEASQRNTILSRVSYDSEIRGLQQADLIMESVTEDLDLKKSLFSDISRHVRPEAILVTNTASLSVSEIATAVSHPERMAGMHFFYPVDRMRLVEVVRADRTSNGTVMTVASLAKRMGKIPVVVRDGPGFVVNRLLVPYINAATHLLESSVPAEQIDQAFLDFGMPMGALALLDMVGIDIALEVAQNLYARLGERMRPSPLLHVFHAAGRLGRKSGRGFYRYDRRGRPKVDRSLPRFLKSHLTGKKDLEDLEIVDRVIFPMVNEAARCLEEDIVDAPEAVDTALIFGAGFPAFTGGLLRFADTVGVANIANTLENLSQEDPVHFSPTGLLIDMARKGARFYTNPTDIPS